MGVKMPSINHEGEILETIPTLGNKPKVKFHVLVAA